MGTIDQAEQSKLTWHTLVLDDDEGNRQVLDFTLQMNGFSVVQARTGAEAVAAFKPDKYDVVFLDVELPDMNGINIARHIRLIDEKVIIVVSTVDDDSRTVHNALDIGCDIYLVKPFDFQALQTLVKQLKTLPARHTHHILLVDNMGGMHNIQRRNNTNFATV